MTFKRYLEQKLHGIAAKENLKSSDVDQAELARGIKVEKEHTNDHATAKKIAMDHLAEDPHYYKKLAKAKL